MSGAVGRVTLPEQRQGTLRAMLMRHYEGKVEFWKDWAPLLCHYERLIEALVHPRNGRPRHRWVERHAAEEEAWQALDAAIDRGPVATNAGGERRVSTRGGEYMERESRNTHLRCYRQELVDLCNKWGLRCEWAPAWIHASYVERVTQVVPAEELKAIVDKVSEGHRPRLRHIWSLSIGTWLAGEPRIHIDIPYDPWPVDNWKDVHEAVDKEACRQRDEIRAQYVQAGFSLKKKRPSLALHVEWLYLAICPQPDTGKPLGWTEIKRFKDWPGKGEFLTPSAIQKAVDPLAAELGIDLPDDLKAGRPPKY